MRCPRCQSFLIDDVVFLSDGPEGLYAVVDAPVVDHLIACRCGADIAVSSTRAAPSTTSPWVASAAREGREISTGEGPSAPLRPCAALHGAQPHREGRGP